MKLQMKFMVSLLAELFKSDLEFGDRENEYIKFYIYDRNTVTDAKKIYDLFLKKVSEEPIDFEEYIISHTPSEIIDKISILITLFEIIIVDHDIDPNELNLLYKIIEHFQISEQAVKTLECVFFENDLSCLKVYPIYMLPGDSFNINIPNLSGELIFFEIENHIFIRNNCNDIIVLNNSILRKDHTSFFNEHAILEVGSKVILYDDIFRIFHPSEKYENIQIQKIEIDRLSYNYPDSTIGVDDVSFSLESGDFLLIIGKSGSGKTTLCNLIIGNLKPKNPKSILINNKQLYKYFDSFKKYFGNVPQDDLSLENLTVFENLYFNARLRFPFLADDQIIEKVETVLGDLELEHVANHRVGNPLEKTLSGGERKRHNIGIELIADFEILVLDEPTWGLSSKDSENIIFILKKLSNRGKIIICILHQPSTGLNM